MQLPCCRGLCGDTPDVSKAMRLLVSCKLLAKTGRGGRLTPFVYKVCCSLCQLCCQELCKQPFEPSAGSSGACAAAGMAVGPGVCCIRCSMQDPKLHKC